jgi:hypothetical protein
MEEPKPDFLYTPLAKGIPELAYEIMKLYGMIDDEIEQEYKQLQEYMLKRIDEAQHGRAS